MTKRPDALTPAQAAEWIDALPPVELKNRLLDYLLWQASHGKRLLHSAHYFRVAHYGFQPRASTVEKRLAPLRALTQQIGGSR